MSEHEITKAPPSFDDDLCRLINMHGIENESNTPDWVLARLLVRTLNAYADASRASGVFNGDCTLGSE